MPLLPFELRFPGLARPEAPADAGPAAADVFSAARHGRHKKVEEALAAGFNPKSADTSAQGRVATAPIARTAA